MLTATNRRVENNTCESVNQQIAQETRDRLRELSRKGPQAIEERLLELDHEWDIERVLETNASSLALTGVILAATVDRRWLVLPGLVTGFLLQHALQGWCPPLPFLRRMGFRTLTEINEERYALKAFRGDFKNTAGAGNKHDPARAIAAASQ